MNMKLVITLFAVGALALGAYYGFSEHNFVTDKAANRDHKVDNGSNAKSAPPPIVEESLLSARLIGANGPTIVGDQLGELTLVNFWASWCAPRRHEMPIFETMYRQAKASGSNQSGFQILGIAIDSQNKAQPFLDSMDITYPILYAEKTGYMLMESVGNQQGLLPYSILLDKDGKVIEQILGRIDEQQITNWLEVYL